MLEKLNFTYDEYKLKIELEMRDRKLFYRVQHADEIAEFTELEGGRRYLRRLEKIHLETWRASYQPEIPPTVHNLWRLGFVSKKFGRRRIVGDSAYPTAWAAFIDLLNELPGVEIHKVRQLEQVSLILHDTMENPGGNIYLPKQREIPLTEKLIINRGKHLLVFTRHKQGIGTERHAYDSVLNVPLLLERIAAAAADFSRQTDTLADDFLPQVEWRFIWHDGTENCGSYTLKGKDMPPAWQSLIAEIEKFTGNVRSRLF